MLLVPPVAPSLLVLVTACWLLLVARSQAWLPPAASACYLLLLLLLAWLRAAGLLLHRLLHRQLLVSWAAKVLPQRVQAPPMPAAALAAALLPASAACWPGCPAAAARPLHPHLLVQLVTWAMVPAPLALAPKASYPAATLPLLLPLPPTWACLLPQHPLLLRCLLVPMAPWA